VAQDSIEDRIARRVVELLEQRKFRIEQKRWPEILDLETAAEYMCRTVQAVRNLVRTGQIPAMRGDRKVQLRKCDIDAWAARMTQAR
jgi:helix-turn-helix protein